MLGKASEVKIRNFEFLTEYDAWCLENPEFLIVDMKFQASQEGSILLVIYKEGKSQPSEFIDKEKLLTDIRANQAAKAWDIQKWIEDGEFDVRGGATP